MNCPHCGKPLVWKQGDLFETPKAGSIYLPDGTKARQRNDPDLCGDKPCLRRDRNFEFREALRRHRVPCFDVDEVITNGQNVLRCVVELTRPEDVVSSPLGYLTSIDARRRSTSHGNHNDQITMVVAEKLGCAAILVVFQPDVYTNDDSPVWWRHLDKDDWNYDNPIPAKRFLTALRKKATQP